MKYQIDHDIHIHTQLSPCSSDPAQNPQCILDYAVSHNLKHIVITDHFWDELVPGNSIGWPGYATLSKWLPLPQAEGVNFHFGCEADMNMMATVGISKETAKKFDFIIVPTTHMHFPGVTVREEEYNDKKARAMRYVERWDSLLNSDLPFHKIGLAHITWAGLAGGMWQEHLDILDSIPDDTFKRLFAQSEKQGMGIELNVNLDSYSPAEFEHLLRVYRIAVECGCHFYFGSDAHHPEGLDKGYQNFAKWVDILDLQEEQKFNPFK